VHQDATPALTQAPKRVPPMEGHFHLAVLPCKTVVIALTTDLCAMELLQATAQRNSVPNTLRGQCQISEGQRLQENVGKLDRVNLHPYFYSARTIDWFVLIYFICLLFLLFFSLFSKPFCIYL
jgi:hypothetical protein